MGFYHPATLVKDAQRRGVRFAPVDVQTSEWACRIEDDGAIRLGLSYVKGLREDAGRRIVGAKGDGRRAAGSGFRAVEDLVTRAVLRRDEVRVLAEGGALASLGLDRRTALWQAEWAGRPAGPLWTEDEEPPRAGGSPLPIMSLAERVQADYDRTGLTIGPHPMAFVRQALAARGVARAIDLRHQRAGRRVRVAGAVITRQRPGTAKGFDFLSLEDETGIANVIIPPPVYATDKRTLVEAPYLIVDGILQNQDGAVSVKAERIDALAHEGPRVESHDFH
jgi:error-prone DNA polymerase